MFWNETTSVFNENIENSSAGSVEDVTLNLGLAVPMGIVMYLLSLVTVVGNAMVLHAIRTERRLQTVSTNFPTTILLLAGLYSLILSIPPSVPAVNIIFFFKITLVRLLSIDILGGQRIYIVASRSMRCWI
jgi:hypothetical protein